MIENTLSLLQYDFILRSMLAGVMVAVAASLLGMFLVLRHLSLISDGLSHTTFGTIGFAIFLGLQPFYLSLILAVLVALLIMFLYHRIGGDVAIGMVSSLGLALGILFLSGSQGFTPDIFSYLFGNILTITSADLWLSIFLSLLVFLLLSFFYWDLFAITFDDPFAMSIGIKRKFFNSLLMVLTAIVVVLAIRLVGALLVSALMIFPAVTALYLGKNFKTSMVLCFIIAIISVLTGMILSFMLNLPSGPMIVLANGGFFILAWVWQKIKLA